MTCAGYLVVDNNRPAFVEISTGVLVCSLLDVNGSGGSASDADEDFDTPVVDAEASPSSVDGAMERAGQDTKEALRQEMGLPPLEPRRMPKLEVLYASSAAQRHKMAGEKEKPNEVVDKSTEAETETAVVKPLQRVLQLSGFLVEVEEREHALDAPSLPCSFQVNTFKLSLQPDGSSRSALHDSLILTAPDEAAKRLWVKHLAFWNRFGWRDTLSVHAEARDLALLCRVLRDAVDTPLQCDPQPRHSSAEALLRPDAALYARRSSLGGGRAPVGQGRPTRRRFYRTAAPSNLVPPA